MDDYRQLALLETHMADLRRDSDRSWRGDGGARRVGARGTILILMAVLMVGMLAWLVH